VNPANGQLGIVYNDRGNANGALYGVALAEGLPGSFVKTTVSTAQSNPVVSKYFQAGGGPCALCALVGGSYINVSYGSDGHANVVWTDMRDSTVDGFAQFVYYARK